MSLIATTRHAIGRKVRNARRNRSDGVGHSFVEDVRQRLPHVPIEVIFDVGANIGLTAIEFTDEFPGAMLHAFEPGSANFARMDEVLVGKPDVKRHRVGFSDTQGSASLLTEPDHPTTARLSGNGASGPTEVVALDTIDNFCATNGISRIDFLKIDTEGHEVSVLKGAARMLAAHDIALIKAETAIDPDSSYHTQLPDLCALLHPLGYRLFGLYDQWEDTMVPGHPRLRRFDAAFISPKVARRPDA